MLKRNKMTLNEKEDAHKLHFDYITVIIASSGVLTVTYLEFSWLDWV